MTTTANAFQPAGAEPSARAARIWAARIPISGEALGLGAWLVAVFSSELAIHGVGPSISSAMVPFLALTAAVAVLAGQRYVATQLPHWLLASFSATVLSLNGFLWAFTDLGTTLHDVHLASDMAAIGTMFFLLFESFMPGVPVSRAASVAGLLSCCGFLLVVPALLFGLGPAGVSQLLPLILSEQTASILALPIWTPFVGLVPAVVALIASNAFLTGNDPDAGRRESPGGSSCHTTPTSDSAGQEQAASGECTTGIAATMNLGRTRERVIGTLGTASRAIVGVAFIAFAVVYYRAELRDALIGVVVLPAAVTLLLALRGRDAPPLRLGAAGHVVTIGIVVGLLMVFPGETVLLFYGSTMVVAAAFGNGGCEVTALSNWLRGRDDQVGCPLFEPFDALDRRARARSRAVQERI